MPRSTFTNHLEKTHRLQGHPFVTSVKVPYGWRDITFTEANFLLNPDLYFKYETQG